jgi:creatinine amidohydrolase
MLRLLARVTSDELREATASGRAIAVVPIGSVEQHGPHGPLGTDAFCAEAVARVVADELDACLAPTLPYGESSIHREFPGAIWLGPTTLTLVVRDLCLSLADSGFAFLVLVNGHNTNLPSILAGAREARLVRNVGIAATSYWEALRSDYRDLLPESSGEMPLRGFNAHGGVMEMSLCMFHAPGSVHMERAEAGDIHRAELIGDPTLTYVTMFQDYSPSGAFGDPTGSAPELGERIARAAGGAIARRARLLQDTFIRPVAAEHEPGRPRSAQA